MNTYKKIGVYTLALGTLYMGLNASLAPVLAQKASPTPSTGPTVKPTAAEKKPIDDTIQLIKDKIEDKVEQINKSSKKVIAGNLEKVEDDTLELVQSDGKNFKVSIDSTITEFFSVVAGKTSELEKSDLEKGDHVIVFGPIIEDQISANKILRQTQYLNAQGEITSVDKDNFTLDIVTNDKEELTLDIEDKSTQRLMDAKALTLAKAGFSKYKVGDKIHVVYTKPAKEGANVSALRVLIIPQEFFSKASVSVTPKK